MKRLIAFILLFTLAANAFAAAGVCMMQYEATGFQPELELESKSMPCHDLDKDKQTQVNSNHTSPEAQDSHLCDCDKCAQYAQSFISLILNTLALESPSSDLTQHQSLTFSPNYRPPIFFFL